MYDANEEDSGEDMRCKLDVLKTNYTTLAELCEFPIPGNVGPTGQGWNDGSDESEIMSPLSLILTVTMITSKKKTLARKTMSKG